MKSAETIKFAGEYPECFPNNAQYREWKIAAARSFIPMYGPCTDCVPGFQALMKEQRRCENPHVRFKKFPDGGVEGFVSFKEEE